MCKFVTYKQIVNWLMRLRNIILSMIACLAMVSAAQPVSNQQEWEWYLGEVVNDVFVGRNYFEYYYTPSAADMEQQRSKGEVTYFLNSPEGLNSKKVRDMVDRLMASYDDIKAVCDWQMTNTTYWKEFRFEKNKFRFSVKRKALDDGTYYVSATETANYYHSLKSKDSNSKKKSIRENKKKETAASDKPSRRNNRRAITQDDIDAAEVENPVTDTTDQDEEIAPAVSEKERRRAAREREQAREQEQRLAKRKAQEQQRLEAKKQKEAEKQKKAEEKKKKEEEKRLAQEKKRKEREQAKQEREQAAREQAAERKQGAQHKTIQSKYHYSDIALWLSEKYDFTQTAGGDNSCTMFSSAVKDVEMAKLAIKNALKGSNARMAVPWRLNSETQAIETGYTVDNQVLVFTISKDAEERIAITVTEIDQDDFELFKQSLNNN